LTAFDGLPAPLMFEPFRFSNLFGAFGRRWLIPFTEEVTSYY
jgi:hypothetical protein